MANRDLVKSLERLPGTGRPRKISMRVTAIPFQYRKNIRTLDFKIGIPKSTIHDALKRGHLKHTCNSIRPILTDKNKADRVAYWHRYVQDGQFTDMLERVDIEHR